MYYNGEGVPKDYSQAASAFRLSADQGFAEGQYWLGVMYARGLGVAKDHSEAVRLYGLAADKGNTDAQMGLGAMYALGMGVPQDYTKGYFWFTIAAVGGNPTAIKLRDGYERRMTLAQVAEAQKMAREWKPKDSK